MVYICSDLLDTRVNLSMYFWVLEGPLPCSIQLFMIGTHVYSVFMASRKRRKYCWVFVWTYPRGGRGMFLNVQIIIFNKLYKVLNWKWTRILLFPPTFVTSVSFGLWWQVILPPDGYLKAVRDLCSKYNVLMIADEIQSGLGRSGRMLACDWEGVRPDVVVRTFI